MDAPKDDIAAGVAVSALLADYAAAIDEDALEDWPDFFTADALYRITTARDHSAGQPIGIIYADNRAMLEDRVAALRKANVYETQAYRHIVSSVRITARNSASVDAEASFMVVRTMTDGSQDMFATGRYIDTIDFSGNRPRFSKKIVVLDSEKVDTLLAIPL